MAYFVILDGNEVTVKEAAAISGAFPSKEAADAHAASLRSILPPAPSKPASEPRKRRRRRLRCLQTETVYDSVAEAARATGNVPTAIFRHLRDPVKFWSCRGFTFEWEKQ